MPLLTHFLLLFWVYVFHSCTKKGVGMGDSQLKLHGGRVIMSLLLLPSLNTATSCTRYLPNFLHGKRDKLFGFIIFRRRHHHHHHMWQDRPEDDRWEEWTGECSLHPAAHTVHVGLTTHRSRLFILLHHRHFYFIFFNFFLSFFFGNIR